MTKKGRKLLIVCAFFIFCGFGSCDKQAPRPTAEVTVPGTTQSSIQSPAEKRAYYRWLLNEMYEVVLLQKQVSAEASSNWINILVQGASFEGVYHGLVLSTEYRALEQGVANGAANQFFAHEMDDFRGGKQFDVISRESLSKSLFTLKRELGEEILSQVEKRRAKKEELASWYATLAVRWADKNVNFGLPERNRNDFEFHKKWAMANSIGQVQWELLNRAHRILNSLGGATAK